MESIAWGHVLKLCLPSKKLFLQSLLGIVGRALGTGEFMAPLRPHFGLATTLSVASGNSVM